MLEILAARSAFLSSSGVEIEIAAICVRDTGKTRPYVPEGCKVTTDYNEILEDPTINLVCEVMGGTTDARAVVCGALQRGKHVVTANKALIAEFLPEIQALLAEKPGVYFGLEAAVCGGIPVIHTLQHELLGDKISKVTGIMNGTTNYMLSKMESEGMQYADVLKEAQDLGFAEADPSADVDGFDVRAKIALLCKLALGQHVPVEQVETMGITGITKFDFIYAKHLKCTIKLLGKAQLTNDEVTILVSPMLVSTSNPLASISGATNAVSISSHNLGTSFLVGQGAGGMPTANSVVSDILGIAKGHAAVNAFAKIAPTALASDYTSCFYIRFMVEDQLGILFAITKACFENKVSIDQVVQIPPDSQGWNRSCCPFVLLTDDAKLSQVKAVCTQLGEESWNASPPFFMPLHSM